MAISPTQSSRIIKLATPLGPDKLVLARLEGSEGLSDLFEFRVDALSETAGIDFNPAIGTNCCVKIQNYQNPPRFINGIMVGTQWTGMQYQLYSYRLIMRPWLWLLSRAGGCRMFKEKSIPDIIKDVFGKHGGFAKFETKLTGDYPALKYCVQYRESDLNFVSRLMEAAGIYYFFKHTEQDHVLVLCDSLSAHEPKESGETIDYRPIPGRQRRKEENLFNWFPERTFNTGKVVLKDYDFWQPGNSLICEKALGGGYQNDSLEMFDYPGKYKESGLGNDYVKVRLESEQAADKRCQATGDAVSCVPGYLCKLAEHPQDSQNKRYLITRASHTFVSDTYRSTDSIAAEEAYTGHYEFLPSDVPFRAPIVTPRPVVHGPQTAVVVGKEGEEIDVDEDGCIMVKFHWDREEQQSRRVRLAQVWSGNKWGGIYIPRIGQEVIVQFVEGDPDRPMVIGTVYNADNPVPYDLPSKKTIAGVKSKSTPGSGYNEFIFDDAAGQELIRMHGQKDLSSVIEHDEYREVKNDVERKTGKDEKVDVGNTLKVTAGTLIELTVGQSKIKMQPGSISITSPKITIKADMTLDAIGNITTVKGNATLVLKGGVVLIN